MTNIIIFFGFLGIAILLREVLQVLIVIKLRSEQSSEYLLKIVHELENKTDLRTPQSVDLRDVEEYLKKIHHTLGDIESLVDVIKDEKVICPDV